MNSIETEVRSVSSSEIFFGDPAACSIPGETNAKETKNDQIN